MQDDNRCKVEVQQWHEGFKQWQGMHADLHGAVSGGVRGGDPGFGGGGARYCCGVGGTTLRLRMLRLQAGSGSSRLAFAGVLMVEVRGDTCSAQASRGADKR